MAGNIKDKEDYLRETKQLMEENFETYGVTNLGPFRNYAEGITLAVESKVIGMMDGSTPFTLDERDLRGVKLIRRYACYRNSALKTLTVPETISSIDPNAFYECKNLEQLTLLGYIILQQGCFYGCTGLKKVYLPDSPPLLMNSNVFYQLSPECELIVPNQAALERYKTDSNWNVYDLQFKVQEVET